MKGLIKIKKMNIGNSENNSVNARELYNYLEIKKDFSNWIKDQIQRAGFEKDIDYTVFAQKGERELSGLQGKIEYIITLDTAKHIAMMSGVAKGKETRKYFIECEKELLNQKAIQIPTHLQTAKMLVNALEEKEQLLLENKNLNQENQTLEITNNILMHTNKLYTATEIAKELDFPSAIILNKKLEDMKIQYRVNNSWVLSSKYSNLGYTSIKQYILENGKVVYDRKFTQKGRDFILKLFQEQEDIKQQESYIIKNNDILQQGEIYAYRFKHFN